MASGYKLRLGDGTTVLLDDKGLATWLQGGLVDDKARVQPAGSKQWLTLRQLMIAVERATREREVEQKRLAAQRQVVEERAEAERRAAEEQAEAERLTEDRLAEERLAEERLAEVHLAEERLAAERLAAERLAAEEQAAREIRVERERLAAERRSARERAEAERHAAEEQAALARVTEERLAAERLANEERAERERQVAQERLAAERRSASERAKAERRAAEEQAALARVTEQRLAAERLAAEEQAAREIRAQQERLAAERRSARERAKAEHRAEQGREAELETLELEPLSEAELEEALPEAELDEPDVSAADLGLVPVEWPVADERPEPPPPPIARAERPPAPAPSFRTLEGRPTSFLETLRPGWAAAAERVRSLARWSRPAAAPRPALAAPFGEMPHALAVPPPSLRDLPVIPLAEMDEPTGDDDEGQGGWLANLREAFLQSRAGEIAPRLWVWCKRVTLTAALLLIAALLASHTSVWLPATTEVGIALFGQVDKIKERVAPSTLPPAAAAAMAAASEQLPHLRSETIELIMASSAHRALEPPQVFRLAGDAVERGRAALGPSSGAELDRLTEALTAELPRAERKRLGEYLERVRVRAATAPFEDQEAVWLMARAARRLPAEKLSRLQDLFARAAAAGLQPTASAPG